MFNLFGGKSAKEGVEGRTAVKGNRKATINETTGQIVDLSEEKVYDLDFKKKQYTVTTFDEIRRRMREAEERAKKEAQKEDPAAARSRRSRRRNTRSTSTSRTPARRSRSPATTRKNTIVTVTVREKGKTLEQAGGMVMTNDMWLGPQIPALKEIADFDMRYWKQLQGPQAAADLGGADGAWSSRCSRWSARRWTAWPRTATSWPARRSRRR